MWEFDVVEPPTINFILRVKKMSNKILEVTGRGTRQVHEYAYGSFHSAHKQEDIENWLEHRDVKENTCEFEEVFGDDWNEDYADDYIEDFEVEFDESEDTDNVFFEFEEEIQEFLDEEPKRERDAGIRRVNYQLKDLIGNIDGIKDTTIQLFNDFKKVVKSDDVENLSEEEKKLYQTLNDMTQLSLKFPKPEVEKETYEPF